MNTGLLSCAMLACVAISAAQSGDVELLMKRVLLALTKKEAIVCSDITLARNPDGVTSDSSGLADESTLYRNGDWIWVKLKLAEITDMQLLNVVNGAQCTGLTYNGRPAGGYGIYDGGNSAYQGGIYTDLGCQAKFRVCGKRDDVVCSDITLTQDGVTSDPSNMADLSTLKKNGMWMWVKVKFTEITNVQLVRAVAGSSCTDLTYNGRSAPGYDKYDGGIFTDLGCQAELRVCGKQCVDETHKCQGWARDGYCENAEYSEWMLEHCKASCTVCGDCVAVDQDADCPDWQNDYCDSTEPSTQKFMWENCNATCAFCARSNCDRDDEFKCDNGKCIRSSWHCDNYDDCGDNSDEKESRGCEKFTCNNGDKIPKKWECNNPKLPDCDDRSDEGPLHCNPGSTCKPGEFTCANGWCIRGENKCDNFDNCGDYSDEITSYCQSPRDCDAYEFKCDNGKCIHSSRQCNNVDNCGDNSDENEDRGCEKFTCNNGDKIPKKWECDGGVPDCWDRSDEGPLHCNPGTQCKPGEFNCANGWCIAGYKKCDYFDDCGDNSDEPQDCRYVDDSETNTIDLSHTIPDVYRYRKREEEKRKKERVNE